VAQYLTKRAKGPRCAETGKPLAGIPHLTTQKLKRLPKNQRTVARAYGGVLSGPVVRDRIINAFMEEEARAAAEKKALAEKKEVKKKGKKTPFSVCTWSGKGVYPKCPPAMRE
jgi:large subunit ribosomal protein L34e